MTTVRIGLHLLTRMYAVVEAAKASQEALDRYEADPGGETEKLYSQCEDANDRLDAAIAEYERAARRASR